MSPELRHWNLDEPLQMITCPVLLVQGERDRFGSIAQLTRIAQQVSGPCFQAHLPDIDHWPHRECAEHLIDLVISFAESIDP
jgi:pimeloyl-ACP methyl ester carboxylesterase